MPVEDDRQCQLRMLVIVLRTGTLPSQPVLLEVDDASCLNTMWGPHTYCL